MKKSNLLDFYHNYEGQYTDDEINWYRNMSTMISLSGTPDSFMRDCAMFSFMSINMTIAGNISKFENYCNTGEYKGLFMNKFKALQLAESQIEMMDILGGKKVQNFFMNLYQPDNPDYVTIDRWAMRILGYDGKVSRSNYDKAAKMYFEVAKELHLLPNILQSCTWVKKVYYEK